MDLPGGFINDGRDAAGPVLRERWRRSRAAGTQAGGAGGDPPAQSGPRRDTVHCFAADADGDDTAMIVDEGEIAQALSVEQASAPLETTRTAGGCRRARTGKMSGRDARAAPRCIAAEIRGTALRLRDPAIMRDVRCRGREIRTRGSLMVGEAPGGQRGPARRPFVAPAGRFSTCFLASGVAREEDLHHKCFKSRPPGQPRSRADAGRRHSWPWLEGSDRGDRARVVVPLGRHALATLRSPVKIAGVTGRAHRTGENARCSRCTPGRGAPRRQVRRSVLREELRHWDVSLKLSRHYSL